MPNSIGNPKYHPIAVGDLVNAEKKKNLKKVAIFLSPPPKKSKNELFLQEMEKQLEKMVDELLS